MVARNGCCSSRWSWPCRHSNRASKNGGRCHINQETLTTNNIPWTSQFLRIYSMRHLYPSCSEKPISVVPMMAKSLWFYRQGKRMNRSSLQHKLRLVVPVGFLLYCPLRHSQSLQQLNLMFLPCDFQLAHNNGCLTALLMTAVSMPPRILYYPKWQQWHWAWPSHPNPLFSITYDWRLGYRRNCLELETLA